MKILLLSDTNSEHTEKWARGLADTGMEIGLFSFNKSSYEWTNHPRITVFFEPDHSINADSLLTKLSYLKYVRVLKKIIKHFQPDILHAHYASSYGLIGALCRFHPFVLSVWGKDVYDFPKRSAMHRKLLQHNLKKADLLLSTSHIMREEIAHYTSKPVEVMPFGVDTKVFRKQTVHEDHKQLLHVGTIKPIEEKYGIEYIIEAAQMLKQDDKKIRYYLVGPGGNLQHYKDLIASKGLESSFEVTGRIPFSRIQDYHNLLDIFLNVSIDDSESFGVATVEAMACEKPVIVSDVGGLKEVVRGGEYGVVVKRKDARALADAIQKLADDPQACASLGKKAREHVLLHYDWDHNLEAMSGLYHSLLTPAHGATTN